MDSPISARCAVLLVLSRRASYAAAIIEQVYVATEERVHLADSIVYPLLRKLEAEGLVRECSDAERQHGVAGSQGRYLGRPVRMFALTEEGRQEAEADATLIRALLGISPGEGAASATEAAR